MWHRPLPHPDIVYLELTHLPGFWRWQLTLSTSDSVISSSWTIALGERSYSKITKLASWDSQVGMDIIEGWFSWSLWKPSETELVRDRPRSWCYIFSTTGLFWLNTEGGNTLLWVMNHVLFRGWLWTSSLNFILGLVRNTESQEPQP